MMELFGFQQNVILATGPTGHHSALIHPCGRAYVYGDQLDVMTLDRESNCL